jgi:hypothetical protein
LIRLDKPINTISPGSLVGYRLARVLDLADGVLDDLSDMSVDPGTGIVVAVYPDEFIPDSKDLGLVASVIWSREPNIDGNTQVTVPYVSGNPGPVMLTKEDFKPRPGILRKFVNLIKGK